MEGDFSFSHVFLSDEDHDSKDLRQLYGAFRRAKAGTDATARRWVEAEAPDPHSLDPVEADSGRLLLPKAGLDGEDLVGALHTDGTVSIHLAPSGGGSSGRPGDFGLVVNGQRRGTRVLVFGLVADGVRAVTVVASGVERQARMGENAFACAFSDAGDDLQRVVLTMEDGSAETVELAG